MSEKKVERRKRQRVRPVKAVDISIDSSDTELSAGLWDSETRAFIDGATLKGLFYGEDWVFICTDLIASEISNLPFKVFKKKIVNGETVLEPNDAHPVNALLEKPNGLQDRTAFMYCVAVEYVLMGNAICWRARMNNQLWSLGAELVQMMPNNDGQTFQYLYNRGAYDSLAITPSLNQSALKFDQRDVMHIRRPNPSSLLWGLSPFIPGRKSILFNRYSQDYLNAFYLKGASPQIALEMERNASEESTIRMLRSFEMAYTGRRNMRRTLLLPKGVKANQINIPIADQNLVDLIKLNREPILNILRIPKHALGLAEAGSLGSEEHKQALKYFYTASVQPTANRLAGGMTSFFERDLGPGNVIAPDYSEVAILKEDELKKAELAEKRLKTHTLNEVRRDVYKDPPLPGGDVTPIVNPAPQPFGQPAPQPVQAPAPVAVQEAVPEKLPQAPAPQPAEQAAQPPVVIQPGTDSDAKAPKEPLLDDHPVIKKLMDIYGPRYTEREKAVNDDVDGKLPAMHTMTLKYMVMMAEGAIKAVLRAVHPQSKGYDEDVDNILGRGSDEPAKKPNAAKLRREIKREMDKLGQSWRDDYAQTLSTSVDVGYDTQMRMLFTAESRAAVEALKQRDAKDRLEILKARGLDSFAQISSTTTDAIVDRVQKGAENNKTVLEITQEIGKYFKEVGASRAETIARTETLSAVSIGQAAQMENSAEVIPGLKKVWINAGDERVRGNPSGIYPNSHANHWKLQGQVRDHDKEFSNGLMYPRDSSSGKAAEVINCRCTVLAVPPEDLADLDIPKE